MPVSIRELLSTLDLTDLADEDRDALQEFIAKSPLRSTPTNLPWEVGSTTGPRGEIALHVWNEWGGGIDEICSMQMDYPDGVPRANAELIVRAVNNHGALLDQLGRARDELVSLNQSENDGGALIRAIDEAINAAEAPIP